MRHLRIYRAIQLTVEEGSIRKAAERLAISPSALNRSIQAFEAELGIEIFERVSSGVRLSVSGELLIRPISEHLAQIDDFRGLIEEMRGGQAGALRLSVAEDAWAELTADVVDEFRVNHPAFDLDLCFDNGLSRLRSRQVDLALVTVPVSGEDVEVLLSERVAVRGLVPARRGGYTAALTLADLMDHRIILPQFGTGLRLSFDLLLRRTGVEPAAVLTLPGLPTRLQTTPVPDLRLVLGCPRPADVQGASQADLKDLRLQPVQVTLVARAGGYLPRAAERFAVSLGAALDALAMP